MANFLSTHGLLGAAQNLLLRGLNPNPAASITVDPIEIQIRDGITSIASIHLNSGNGYYYTVGDINEWKRANVETWPRLLIDIDENEIIYDDNQSPSSCYYRNRQNYIVRYEHKNTLDVGQVDRDKVYSKLAHDLKKLFGKYYLLVDYGCYQVMPISCRPIHNKNETYSTICEMVISCEFLQQRDTPTSG